MDGGLCGRSGLETFGRRAVARSGDRPQLGARQRPGGPSSALAGLVPGDPAKPTLAAQVFEELGPPIR